MATSTIVIVVAMVVLIAEIIWFRRVAIVTPQASWLIFLAALNLLLIAAFITLSDENFIRLLGIVGSASFVAKVLNAVGKDAKARLDRNANHFPKHSVFRLLANNERNLTYSELSMQLTPALMYITVTITKLL